MNQEVESVAEPGKDERTWGMLCHLVAFSGLIVPFGAIIGPLIIWLIKKDEMPFVDDQGKESLNFQLTMFIAAIITFILCFILIGWLIAPVLIVYYLIVLIIASIKANDGIRYRYPYTIRFLK